MCHLPLNDSKGGKTRIYLVTEAAMTLGVSRPYFSEEKTETHRQSLTPGGKSGDQGALNLGSVLPTLSAPQERLACDLPTCPLLLHLLRASEFLSLLH